jgi:hypothetical protein
MAMKAFRQTLTHVVLVFMVMAGLLFTPVPVVRAGQTDIVGPVGSEQFGKSVTVLPNGNIVVTDPYYDDGSTVDVGAVYLYDGATLAIISTLTGSTAGDRVGEGSVVALSNGNYVVISRYWDNDGTTDAGAVTWGDGTTGVSGVVSSTNSLVGSTADDRVGSVTALANGNYVVRSSNWDNGATTNAGAVTWGNGTTGISGTISSANSLVGSTADDQVGSSMIALSNGNYVVASPVWDNGAGADAGAVTWGSGMTGITGTVSSANSLVGSTPGDYVGLGGVTVLSNGNYVVTSSNWDSGAAADAGAATWGNGTTGITGTISSANSLVGSQTGDRVGQNRVTALSNGNYVVCSPSWDNGPVASAGAATWGSGMTGITGVVTVANSLVGSTANDWVGGSVMALSNGNYVVVSSYWDSGAAANVGAATWGNGTTGITGVVTVTNSLVGNQADDYVSGFGDGVTALANGNYVVHSPYWDNDGVADVGAATWGSGMTGITGVVTVTNSLVGSQANDRVGYYGVTALANGNYVVRSSNWDNGATPDAGAVTWGSGTTGITGVVTVTNSLVGSQANDQVGYPGVTALANGNYVVVSPYWDNGTAPDAGAVTWGSGTTGISGTISSANSLVGSTANDRVGFVTALANGNYVVTSSGWDNGAAADAGAATWGNGTTGITGTISSANSLVGSQTGDRVGGVTALSNGNYVVTSSYWDNGATTDAGAVTLGEGHTGSTVGPVTADNSVRGTAADGGPNLNFAYDDVHNQLVVGRPADNIVTIFTSDIPPVAAAGEDQDVNTGALVTLDGSGSSDPGGHLPLVYHWAQAGGPSVTFNDALSITTFTAPGDPAVLTFTLTITNSLGLPDPTPDEVVVTVNNQAPIASAGNDQNVDTNALVMLDGSGSSDPDGDLPLTYLWTQTGGLAVSFTPGLSITTFTAPSDPAVLTFTLVVTDSLGLPALTSDEVVITVNNQAPETDAGEDQTVDTNTLVTMDGSASSDPDGHLPLTYYWTQTGGPAVTFNVALSVTTFTAPGNPAVLTFTLAVTDSLGMPALTSDEVVITVEGCRIYLPLVVRQDESSATQTGYAHQQAPAMQASFASAGGWPWPIPSAGPPLLLGLAFWRKRRSKEFA